MNVSALAEWIAARYGMPAPAECRLLRSYTNDVYAVTAGSDRFVLKIYGAGWRTEPEVRYEMALLRHLSSRGLPVAAPAGRDSVETLFLPEGPRLTALFHYASGVKPEPPFSLELYVAFGRAIGRMHTLSDDFITTHPRRSLDLSCLIDAPLARTLPLVEDTDDRRFLESVARQVKERIEEFASTGLDWGPIHGDASLDNLHVLPDGEVILYDFDSGGPGWRASDLQGWAVGLAEYQAKYDAFCRGYAEVRPLRDANRAASPYLTLAWDIWGIQVDLENRVLAQGLLATRSYLQERITQIRNRTQPLIF